MKKYDHIVAGSGVAGLTATLLLALAGRKVLLLEKAGKPGGSLARFRINGIPFDTGFHFTGGLTENGLLRRMLEVLGIADAVEPVFLDRDRAHQFVIGDGGRTVVQPCGIKEFRAKLKSDFPGEHAAIDGYFDRFQKVYQDTASTDIMRLGEPGSRLDEDSISLKSVLDGLTGNALLKGMFSALAMCYGVRPSEISFANHSRMCYDMYESTARLRDGGDALVQAFEEQFGRLDVEVRCGTWITGFREGAERTAGSAVLNSGEEIAFDSAVLTIDPRSMPPVLPRKHVSRAFIERVESFEASIGFFTVFGTFEGGALPGFGSSIVSLFPGADIESMLDPSYTGEQAIVIVQSREQVAGAERRVVTLLEPSFPGDVAKWAGTTRGRRPEEYLAYKQSRTESICRRLEKYDGRYAGNLKVHGSASILTYRDYLNSFDGTAYGIKQKMGQFNVIGRLPVRNLFAAGQSALLPGLAGAMMSSFIVSRAILGKENLSRMVSERLCRK